MLCLLIKFVLDLNLLKEYFQVQKGLAEISQQPVIYTEYLVSIDSTCMDHSLHHSLDYIQ